MFNLKFIDLFAGIGGFHLALHRLGAECVFASEIDKFAQQTYFQNFNLKPHGDITQIDEKTIPKHDILTGGFPCQAFSISGKQLGFEDTRGTLFFEIARIAKHHQPKVLLLENVENFLKHNQGETLKTVLNILHQINYDIFYQILNASDFGIPQHRKRLYFVAFRKDLNVQNFEFPKPLNIQTSLKNIILSDEETQHLVIHRDDIILNIQENQSLFALDQIIQQKPIRIGQVGKGGQGERIYSENGHAITLSAHGGGVGAKTGLYLINQKVRKLAPRECSKLMGFPENFKICENKNQAYQQFGNSVVVNVIIEIIKNIFKLGILKS